MSYTWCFQMSPKPPETGQITVQVNNQTVIRSFVHSGKGAPKAAPGLLKSGLNDPGLNIFRTKVTGILKLLRFFYQQPDLGKLGGCIIN